MNRTIGSCVAVLMLVTVSAHAADANKPDEGRGWMFGLGIGPGLVRFGGAEDLAVVIGGGPRRRTYYLFGTPFEAATGQIVSRTLIPADAERIVPIPSAQDGMAVSLHVGWSYSPRWAAVFDFDAVGGYDDALTNFIGGVVGRYSPASRFWIEAGPAFGDLGYSRGGGTVDIEGIGFGMLLGAGAEIMKKTKWRLDVEVRTGTVWYTRFRATNISAQMAVGRRRS